MSYGGTSINQGQDRPQVVDIGASMLAILGLIIVGRVAYGVLRNLSEDDWDSGARVVFLVLNSIVLVFGLLVMALAYQVRRGRMWAWILSLVLLPFALLFGGLMLLITVVGNAVPWAGTGVVLASAAALLTLTVPRPARDYFLRKPAPQGAGAVPGYPWGPGHPSA